MQLAHLSDLHVSQRGSLLVQSRGLLREANNTDEWKTIANHEAWRVQVSRAARKKFMRRDQLRLLDDTDVIIRQLKLKKSSNEDELVAEFLGLAKMRIEHSASVLSKDFPDKGKVRELLRMDPTNTNLRFCAAAHQLLDSPPDWVLLTGDLTDDGIGYALIEEGLKDFVAEARVLVTPGNHDIYPSPSILTRKSERMTVADKRRLWGGFCARIGQPVSSPAMVELDPGVILVILDSAHPTKIPGSHSGAVLEHELQYLQGYFSHRPKELRLCCLHHHIINPPHNVTGNAPIQAAMRLRNAKKVSDILSELDFTVLMNGHRHLGYRYHPAHAPLYLSAPSTTLGCKSGQAPYYWQLSISSGKLQDVSAVEIHDLKGL